MANASLEDLVLNLELALIDPPVYSARLWKNPERMEELKADMSANGLQVPIEVRPKGERFEVVYGDRRFSAAKALGWTTIRCIVKVRDDRGVLLARFAENQHHDKPNPVEDAYYFRELIDKLEMTEADLCDTVGRSPDFVARRLRILRMPEYMVDSIAEEKVPLGVAEALMQITAEDQRQAFLYHAINGEHSIRTVKGWVDGWKATQGPAVESQVVSSAPGQGMPPQPLQMACEVCGPCLDTYNLRSIMVHNWEVALIHKMLAKAKKELAGEVE